MPATLMWNATILDMVDRITQGIKASKVTTAAKKDAEKISWQLRSGILNSFNQNKLKKNIFYIYIKNN